VVLAELDVQLGCCQSWSSPPEEVTAHENLPITPGEKAALFQTNAEHVFGL
jgi:hypothetical protein